MRLVSGLFGDFRKGNFTFGPFGHTCHKSIHSSLLALDVCSASREECVMEANNHVQNFFTSEHLLQVHVPPSSFMWPLPAVADERVVPDEHVRLPGPGQGGSQYEDILSSFPHRLLLAQHHRWCRFTSLYLHVYLKWSVSCLILPTAVRST